MRTFSSSVIVSGGDFLEASVRLTKPIPLAKIFEVMAEIKKIRLAAPLAIGDVVLANPAGTETEAVSYPHLDVYKRQPSSPRPPTPGRAPTSATTIWE